MTHRDEVTAYVERLEAALRPLPKAEREGIVREASSHLCERSDQSSDAFSRAIVSFGPPERYARQFLADRQLRRALAEPGPLPLLIQSVTFATRSMVGFAICLISLFGYVMGLSLLAVALARPFYGNRAGLFVGDGVRFFGVVDSATAERSREVLGFWTMPLGLGLSLLLIVLTTIFLRRVMARFVLSRPGGGA